jgi:hypothetical protein
MKMSEPRSDPLLSGFANLRTMRWLSFQLPLPCAGDCLPVEHSANREGKGRHMQERSFEGQSTWRHAGLT